LRRCGERPCLPDRDQGWLRKTFLRFVAQGLEIISGTRLRLFGNAAQGLFQLLVQLPENLDQDSGCFDRASCIAAGVLFCMGFFFLPFPMQRQATGHSVRAAGGTKGLQR